MKGGERELPKEIERARRRFERWRKNRKKVSRIPERLWASAAEAARLHGVNPTAIALGLDYNHLKRQTRLDPTSTRRKKLTAPSFVELIVPPETRHLPECMIELENARGCKMKIHLQNVELKDLAIWSQAFWNEAQ
jgi:hypothetical protein